MNQSRKWFGDRSEFSLFVALAATGFATSVLTFHLLDGYVFNSGKNLAGVFIPPFLSVCYLTYTSYRYCANRATLGRALLLYLFQVLPFAPLFFQTFSPTPEDDFNRYYLYAKNMVDHHTLWGGDKLYFPQTGYAYATQPGYRYFIAVELLLFNDLYRFVQFLNIALLVTTIFCFQKAIKETVLDKRLQLTVLLVTVLFTPYATKNLLMGLSEWMTAVLLMTVCYLYRHKKNALLSMFILGLASFFRQNLAPAVLLLAFCIAVSNAKRGQLVAAFLLSFFLPLYHNLYYAGEWRFFVKLFATPLLNESKPAGLDFHVLVDNLWRLFGFERLNGKMHFEPVAFLFLPLSAIVCVSLFKQFQASREKLLYGFITLSAVLPGLLLGKDYYPRFEFVSAVVVLVAFCILREGTARYRPSAL